MAFKSTVDALLSESNMLKIALDNQISSGEHMRLLFPHLYESLLSKVPKGKNACVQTTREVEKDQMPWISDLKRKVEKLHVTLTSMHALFQNAYLSDEFIPTDINIDFKSKSGGNRVINSRYRTQLSSQLVDEISRHLLERFDIGFDLLKEAVELSRELKNGVPFSDHDAQPQNFKADRKIPMKSLIPGKKIYTLNKASDIRSKFKLRRSSSMSDIPGAMSQLDKFRSKEKLENVFEETSTVASGSGGYGPKAREHVPPAIRSCHCKGKENMPSTRHGVLNSKNAKNGINSKRQQPDVSTRTRTASQSTERRRTPSVQPRWK